MAAPTLSLAQCAATLRDEPLPAPLITAAKPYLLDTMGCDVQHLGIGRNRHGNAVRTVGGIC